MATLPDLGFSIKAKDEASAVLDKVANSTKELEKGFSLLNPSILGVTVGFSTLTAAVTKSIIEFSESQLRVAKLNDALKNGGVFTEAYSDHLQQVAQSMQDVTRFSDDTVLEVQQLLVTFGLYGTTLDKATKATLDMAETLGIDATSAARILSKAVEGDTEVLKRYGITVDDQIPKNERFAKALELITDKMGGRASAAGDTIVGSFSQAKNAVSNLFETFGGLISQTGVLQKAMQSTTETIKSFYLSLGGGTKLEQLKSQLDSLAKQQAAIDQGFSPNKELISKSLTDQMIKVQKEISQITNEQKKSTLEAQKKFEADQKQLQLIEEQKKRAEELAKLQEKQRKEAEEAARKAAEDLKKLNTLKLQYFQDQNIKINIQDIEGAIKSGNLEVINARKEVILQELQAVDIMNAQSLDDFDRKKQIIEKLSDQIKRLDDAGDKVIRARSDALNTGANLAGQLSSGNVPGLIGSGVGEAAQSGALGQSAIANAGAIASLATAILALVTSFGKLPDLISKGLNDISEGLLNGFPKFIEYLSGPFVDMLMNDFIPKLAQALVRSFGVMISAATKAFIEAIKNIPSMIAGIGKGIFDGIVDLGSSIVSGIGDFLGFGGGPSPEEKAAKVFKALEGAIRELNSELRATVQGILKSFKTPEQNETAAKQGIAALRIGQNVLQSAIESFAKGGKAEEVNKLMQQLADNQKAQVAYYQELYNIENERIDNSINKEKELFDTRVKEQQAIKDSALQLIEQLKGFKAQAVDAFKAVREQIIGSTLTPQANAERLKQDFLNAATPEERAKAATAYAGGLQSQFQALQNLASTGAITGEEFARQREEILKQVADAQQFAVNEFDRLINAQQAIVDRADKQIGILQAGFDRFVAQMEAQRKELRDYFAAQLAKLETLNLNTKNTTATGWTFQKSYAENINNVKGTVTSR